MKRINKVLSIILAAVMTFGILPFAEITVAKAADDTVYTAGIYSYKIINNEYASVVNIIGKATEPLVIPQYLGGYPVKALYDSFGKSVSREYVKNIKTIVLPEGLTSIGNWAFHYASFFDTMVLPKSLTYVGYGCTYGISLQHIYYAGNSSDKSKIHFDYHGLTGSALWDGTWTYNYDISQYYPSEEELNKAKKLHGENTFVVVDLDGNPIDGAKVYVRSQNNLLDEVYESKNGGLISIDFTKLTSKVPDPDFFKPIVTIYAEKNIGNEMFLVSSYNMRGECIYDFEDNNNQITLAYPQFRPEISVAWCKNSEWNSEGVIDILNKYRDDFYTLTEGKILVKGFSSNNVVEYEDNTSVNSSGKDVLITYKDTKTKSSATVYGYKNGGHIWETFTSNNNGVFSSNVMCHESMHFFVGVADEYCTAWCNEGRSYNYSLDIDGDGRIEDKSNLIYLYSSSIDQDGFNRISLPYSTNRFNHDNSLNYYSLKSKLKKPDDFNMKYLFDVWEAAGTYWSGNHCFFKKPIESFGIMDRDNPLFMSTASNYSLNFPTLKKSMNP